MLSVKTNQGTISPPGPVGQHVLMAGHMKMMVQPGPVGPYEGTEQSVSPGLDAGQVGHLPSNQVQPGIEMSHIQPVADGPAGLVRTRHPVGNEMLPALQDGVRPSAGGPVGRFPDPSFRICSKNSSPDDSYQLLVTGPVGANVSDVPFDTGRPTVGDPLVRLTSLDPMGPGAMLSLGDGNQPASISPVGRPWMTGQLESQTGEPDYERSTQIRSESESDAGTLHSVIRTEREVHTGCVKNSVATGQTDPSGVLFSSDSVMHSPGAWIYRTERGSESVAVKPDPLIRTDGGVQTDDMNFATINGQSESSVVSPSSDPGVHSLGEQWEYMSTCSGNSDSIQTRDIRGVVFSHEETYGERDSMSYLSTNGHNSDIADMSDFSDEEDGPHEDVQPDIQTDWVDEDTIKKESISCDQSVLNTLTTGIAPHSLDPNDKEYWTKFRLLTKQAFLLDDVELSESDYPDAVKELVVKSRLTIRAINDRDEAWLELSDYSDDECESSISEDECLHKLDDYKDWYYNRSPVVDIRTTDGDCKSLGNADNADGHGLTLDMGIEDKLVVCSEPDARAKLDLSPTKHDVELDIIGVNCWQLMYVGVHAGPVAWIMLLFFIRQFTFLRVG